MKAYIKQIYDEGLGLTLYKPVENKIKKINSIKMKHILIKVYKVLYLLFAFSIAIVLYIITYPL